MSDEPTQPHIPSASGSGEPVQPSPRFGMPQIEGYQIVGDRPLAEPSMGAVWKAVQLSTKREVALKLISPAFLGADRIRARFEREVELAANLEHPNIARVYDSGIRQGVYCYAMEFIPGKHLDAYVVENHLNQRQILELMEKVCRAVQHAHQRGIIHADLKPSNILATPDGEPHVLDFGLAKLQGENSLAVSRQGQVAGTPPYMSPEQVEGRRDTLDIRSDVYTLGVILYELLIGCSPYGPFSTVDELLGKIREGELRRPRQVSKTIDRELEALLLKAMALAPAERYQSAGDLAQDITNYLNGEPLTAKKPTTTYFILKRIRKHRVPVAVGSMVAAVLLVGAIVSYFRVTQERTKAATAGEDAKQRTARQLLAQADSFVSSGRREEAYQFYREAAQLLNVTDLASLAATNAGVWLAYQQPLVPKQIDELASNSSLRKDVPAPRAQLQLLLAASMGRADWAEMLLANGANASVPDSRRPQPLHAAVLNGHQDVARLLLAHKADINGRDDRANTPLVAVLEAFLRTRSQGIGAPIGMTEVGLRDVVQFLINNGADVNAKQKDGASPLDRTSSKEIAEILLSHGADVNATNWFGTRLHMAVFNGEMDFVELLLARKADANLKDHEGNTPLHFAAKVVKWVKRGDLNHPIAEDLTNLLLDHGANPNAKNDRGETPLHCVFHDDYSEQWLGIVRVLLDHNADANAKNSYGKTPLHLAANRGAKECAGLLLSHNADVNAKDDQNETSLYAAADMGDKELAAFLVSRNADVNAVTKLGRTALHGAVRTFDDTTANLLLSKGANVNAKDQRGDTPLLMATTPQLVELLVSHDADINATNQLGRTALYQALERGDTRTRDFLVSHGATVNIKDKEGFTPLHYATLKETADWLLAHKADVNATNNYGMTPLDVALQYGRASVADFLRIHGGKSGKEIE